MTTAGPTFLLIGAARSGTTLLAKRFADHPDVWFTDPKETHFPGLGGTEAHFTGPGDEETINRAAVVTDEAWRGLFALAGRQPARGEGSVTTLYYATRAVENIRRTCPDARMIAVLRDPVERAWSAYEYQVGRGYETEEFGRALDLEAERVAKGWQHIWHYTRGSEYAERLAVFLDAFPREQLLVFGYEDLVADPAAHLARCFAHIGVDPGVVTTLGPMINAGGEPRIKRVQRAMSGLRSVEPLRRAVKRAVPQTVRERIRTANLEQGSIPVPERERLEEHFAGERSAVRQLLGADAPLWAVA